MNINPNNSSSSSSSSSITPRINNTCSNISLHKVIGFRCNNNNQICINTITNDIIYCVGSLIIIYNYRINKQINYLYGRNSHIINSISISNDNKYISAGESNNNHKLNNSHLILFDSNNGNRIKLVPINANSIIQTKFKPNNNNILLLLCDYYNNDTGSMDRVIKLIDSTANNNVDLIKYEHKFDSNDINNSTNSSINNDNNPIGCIVECIDFSGDGNFFVTGGNQHLTYWYINVNNNNYEIERVDAKLGVHKSAKFVSLVCGLYNTINHSYALTNKGVLCAFTQKDRKRADNNNTNSSTRTPWEIEKWVDLRLDSGNCICINYNNSSIINGGGLLGIGGSDGKVRLFEPDKLLHVATLPRPPVQLGKQEPNNTSNNKQQSAQHGLYGDAVSVQLFPDQSKCLCVYSDKSMILFDIKNPKDKAATIIKHFTQHSDYIFDMIIAKSNITENNDSDDENVNITTNNSNNNKWLLCSDTFITCSRDSSIRLWSCDYNNQTNNIQFKNKYANQDMQAIIYTNQNSHIDNTRPNSSRNNDNINSNDNNTSRPDTAPLSSNNNNNVNINVPRVLCHVPSCVSGTENGMLITGDKMGNLRFYSLVYSANINNNYSINFPELLCIESHNKQVNGLDFDIVSNYAASCSRDGLIHLYNIPNIITTINTNSNSNIHNHITTLPSYNNSTCSILNCKFLIGNNKIISVTNDKILLIRQLTSTTPATINSTIEIKLSSNFNDFALHPNNRYLAVICNDCTIKLYDCISGKLTREYKLKLSNNHCEPIKVTIDNGGMLLAISCSDRTLRIIDWFSGNNLAILTTNHQIITCLKFSVDSTKLYCGTSTGTILIYKLSNNWTQAIKDRIKQLKSNNINLITPRQSNSNKAAALAYLDDLSDDEEKNKVDTHNKNKGNDSIELDLDDITAGLDKNKSIKQHDSPHNNNDNHSNATDINVNDNNNNKVGSPIKSIDPIINSNADNILNNNSRLPVWAQSNVGLNNIKQDNTADNTNNNISNNDSNIILPASVNSNSRWAARAAGGYKLATDNINDNSNINSGSNTSNNSNNNSDIDFALNSSRQLKDKVEDDDSVLLQEIDQNNDNNIEEENNDNNTIEEDKAIKEEIDDDDNNNNNIQVDDKSLLRTSISSAFFAKLKQEKQVNNNYTNNNNESVNNPVTSIIDNKAIHLSNKSNIDDNKESSIQDNDNVYISNIGNNTDNAVKDRSLYNNKCIELENSIKSIINLLNETRQLQIKHSISDNQHLNDQLYQLYNNIQHTIDITKYNNNNNSLLSPIHITSNNNTNPTTNTIGASETALIFDNNNNNTNSNASVLASSQTLQTTLDRYSDLLLQAIMNKLEKKTSKNE